MSDFKFTLTSFLSILDAVGDDILIVNTEGIVIEANVKAKTNLFPGFKRYAREALETTVSKMISSYEVDDPNKIFEKIIALQNSKFLNEKFKIRLKKNNREKYYEVSASPILESTEGVMGRIWRFSDITEEEKLNQEKSDFLMVASHQLHKPVEELNKIIESILNKNFGEVSTLLQVPLAELKKHGKDLSILINDLLNISKLEKDQHAIKTSEINLKDLVIKIATSLRAESEAKKVNVTLKTNSEDLVIVSDFERLNESIKNLLDNAIKFSKENSSVEIEINRLPDKVSIRIRDHGIGIPKSEQTKLFSKFYRGSNVLSNNLKGTGIGLYYVKKAIDDIKGHISYQSVENQGTIFEILIPTKL